MSKKLTLNFTRTRTVVHKASITVDLDDEAAAALREGRNLEAWAKYTVAPHMIKDWTEQHGGPLYPKIEFEAVWADSEVAP